MVTIKSQGFTLFEILVVFVIVGLLSILLLQGFSYVLYLRLQFLRQSILLQQDTMQEYWFRTTTQAIIVDYREGEHNFKGDEQQFSGLTLAALDKDVGVPAPFAWQLQTEGGINRLSYQASNGQQWTILEWLGESGHFYYLDAEGKQHSKWPPKFGLDIPQIPRVILFLGHRRQAPFTWLIKLNDRDFIRFDYQKEEF